MQIVKVFAICVDKIIKQIYNNYRKKARPQTVMPSKLVI